ncbi:MAG: hypothetical protein ACRC2T_19645 [Thermoguttaceae bacterium]
MKNFRNFDYRGISGEIGSVLTPDLFRKFGQVLGSSVPEGGKFLVSSDMRVCDTAFFPHLLDGLRSTGVSVVNVGALPPAVVFYAQQRISAQGSAIITVPLGAECSAQSADESMHVATAGHGSNKLGSVGLIWSIGGNISGTDPLENLRKVAQGEDFRPRVSDSVNELRNLDVTYDYVAWLQETWFDTPFVPMRVVLDPVFGSWVGKARKYLQAVFPRLIFSAIREETLPVLVERMFKESSFISSDQLSAEVDRTRANLGFALGPSDGHLILVDENGVPFSHDELNLLLINSFGEALKGEVFLHNLDCSTKVISAACGFGAEPRSVDQANKSFVDEMRKTSAPLGVTSSGEHYFRATHGNNDVLFTICWIIDFLSHRNVQLSKLRD